MANLISSESLPPIDTYDFLPSTNRWATMGGWCIVLALSGALVASFFIEHRASVKASAVIRPAGESRLVQSAVAGTVTSIHGAENSYVEQGDVIARLDTTSLDAHAVQLHATSRQRRSRLAQIDAQILAVDQQIAAEAAQAQSAVEAAIFDYDAGLRDYQNQQVATDSAVREAQVQLAFLSKEVDSFRTLFNSGATSRLQLSEKEADLAAAQVRLSNLQAALNPSSGRVTSARQRIEQLQASGHSTIAQLEQSKKQLAERRLEVQEELEITEEALAQVNLDLSSAVVKAPTSGTLYDVSLRNPGQVVTSGETLARVIPTNAPIVIKAAVSPAQISKIEVGLSTQMRVAACPFSEFGTAPGRVVSISPDVSASDTIAAQSTAGYSLIIEADRPHLTSNAGKICKLLPGMNAQATIISGKETIMAFLRRKVGGFM